MTALSLILIFILTTILYVKSSISATASLFSTTSVPVSSVSSAAPKESPSQYAARLLSEGICGSFEDGDDIFQSRLMDPDSRKTLLDFGEVKVYRPVLFQKLRSVAGVSDETYLNAINVDNLSCLSSDSKSGQAFWVSNDGNIVVKTLKHYECKNLCRILDSYADHMFQGKSCISSILGIYRVRTKSGIRRYFLVNKNVYPPLDSTSTSTKDHQPQQYQPQQYQQHQELQQSDNGRTMHSFSPGHSHGHVSGSGRVLKRFDLKGSTVGRKAAASSPVQKDLDLIASGQVLPLGPVARSLLLRCLERDAQFLRR
jgi:hypothetical protein